MSKYKKNISEIVTIGIPRHRYVNYLYFVPLDEEVTKEEYLEEYNLSYRNLHHTESPTEKLKEAVEAFDWLVEQGLLKMVE